MSRRGVSAERTGIVLAETMAFLKRYKGGDYTLGEITLGVQAALSVLITKKADDEGIAALMQELTEFL